MPLTSTITTLDIVFTDFLFKMVRNETSTAYDIAATGAAVDCSEVRAVDQLLNEFAVFSHHKLAC